jgi:hypothetical protein
MRASPLLAAATVTIALAMPANAASIRALPLPSGLTIHPEADHRLMSIAADGVVYAVASTIDVRDRTRALRWRAGRVPELFDPIPQQFDEQGYSGPRVEAVVPGRTGAYVTIGRRFSGGYSGTTFRTDRWAGASTVPVALPECARFNYANPHVLAADGDRVALTMDPSSSAVGIDLADPASVAQDLPEATVLDGGRCTRLGAAVVTGLRGASAVGYIGYLNGKPAPWFVNLIVQKMMAKRWLGAHARDLGPGVALAVTSGGVAVGATALPGYPHESMTTNFFGPAGTYTFAVPHAVLWTRSGARLTLLHGDARSVAWDINDSGTVVGMVQAADGRHRAFRRVAGQVELLDDLAHPRGWRFESAYAVTSDGSIAGIGTFRGVATAFLWRSP